MALGRVLAAPEKGYFLTGPAKATKKGVWLGRLEADGRLAWVEAFTGLSDALFADAVNWGEGLAIATVSKGSLNLMQLDVEGDLTWQLSFPAGAAPERYDMALVELAKGDVLVGAVQDMAVLSVVRLTADGDALWFKGYSALSGKNLPDWGWSRLRAIRLANGDALFAAMGTQVVSDSFYNLTDESILTFIRLTPDGQEVWRQYLRLPEGTTDGFDIAPMPEGGFIFSGGYDGGLEYVDPWVARMGDDGKVVWWKVFPDPGNAPAILAQGQNYFAGGGDDGEAWFTLLKGDGEIKWRNTLALSKGFYARDILPASDGYLLAGNAGESGNGVWVIKVSNAGTVHDCTAAPQAGTAMKLLGQNVREKAAYTSGSYKVKEQINDTFMQPVPFEVDSFWNCTGPLR